MAARPRRTPSGASVAGTRARPAAVPDDHHRLVPPDRRDPRAARGAPTAGDRRRGLRGRAARRRPQACIREQEALGLDVLVHGELERTDMVEYFGEQLDGFATTANGWVQSYGSRCVKPPVLFGDIVRPAPMTVGWATLRRRPHRPAREGHAHRAGHHPPVVVRARRPAAVDDRHPARPGPATRSPTCGRRHPDRSRSSGCAPTADPSAASAGTAGATSTTGTPPSPCRSAR